MHPTPNRAGWTRELEVAWMTKHRSIYAIPIQPIGYYNITGITTKTQISVHKDSKENRKGATQSFSKQRGQKQISFMQEFIYFTIDPSGMKLSFRHKESN